ncbi:MAG: hypothetical protein DWH81_03215 [Planctomycetota bacterium]|jgi:hypothetical protein|nr:MAG: hypothetical protein DWH81_03215 [Planctomycetota bacterium]
MAHGFWRDVNQKQYWDDEWTHGASRRLIGRGVASIAGREQGSSESSGNCARHDRFTEFKNPGEVAKKCQRLDLPNLKDRAA